MSTAGNAKRANSNAARDNEDSLRARKLTQLALQFMNTSYPLPSDRIWHDHYPEHENRKSFTKAFARDREGLASCGIYIKGKRRGSSWEWFVDTARSFVGDASLSAADAYLLEYVCSPMIGDSHFPYAQELASALAKVNNCFGSNFPLPKREVVPFNKDDKAKLTSIQQALAQRCVCRVSYTNAQNVSSKRDLCCYGIFNLRNNTYIVAAPMLDSGCPDNTHIKTYRLSRMHSVKLDETRHYVIPDDFYTSDYIMLPFQIGSAQETARFVVDPEQAPAFERRFSRYGSFAHKDRLLIWTVDVADFAACASWAIAHCLIPLEPSCLCDMWHARLEEVLRVGSST
ncbi:MAG: WYL domain-containing protein [Atopobiaceae bacterium]|nr:WYL domain-containing protein [Atopobiaceae bacterium]